MQLTHSLKALWFQPLNPYTENPVTIIAYKWVNLYRYATVLNTLAEKAKQFSSGKHGARLTAGSLYS
jgi:hypothetical protein